MACATDLRQQPHSILCSGCLRLSDFIRGLTGCPRRYVSPRWVKCRHPKRSSAKTPFKTPPLDLGRGNPPPIPVFRCFGGAVGRWGGGPVLRHLPRFSAFKFQASGFSFASFSPSAFIRVHPRPSASIRGSESCPITPAKKNLPLPQKNPSLSCSNLIT